MKEGDHSTAELWDEGFCLSTGIAVVIAATIFGTKRDEVTGERRKLYNEELNPYPTAFPYGNGMVLHFYQQESSTTKTVRKVINKRLKTYV